MRFRSGLLAGLFLQSTLFLSKKHWRYLLVCLGSLSWYNQWLSGNSLESKAKGRQRGCRRIWWRLWSQRRSQAGWLPVSIILPTHGLSVDAYAYTSAFWVSSFKSSSFCGTPVGLLTHQCIIIHCQASPSPWCGHCTSPPVKPLSFVSFMNSLKMLHSCEAPAKIIVDLGDGSHTILNLEMILTPYWTLSTPNLLVRISLRSDAVNSLFIVIP